ncbi:hypothetical protein, partial [Prescottella equi]|uniref:hypothetical protein n=1 Tax=Rhodococcus hoagii TaxID=43767 RepID=UPI001C931735
MEVDHREVDYVGRGGVDGGVERGGVGDFVRVRVVGVEVREVTGRVEEGLGVRELGGVVEALRE